MGGVYEGLAKLTDVRQARGQRYRLETVLLIILLAKLAGEDTPYAIADWAKNNREQLIALMQLPRPNTPSHYTIRRLMSRVVYAEEIERLVGGYNAEEEHGEVYALDGKALHGMRKKDDEDGPKYLLSVYDPERAQGVVERGKVLSQVEVERKENEISQAPSALKWSKLPEK